MTTLTQESPPSGSADADRFDAALAAKGDTLAFERLYRRHIARIHSLARRMLSHEMADEMAQDVFVRAWQKLHLFRGESAFGTWLHRLAINVILAKRGDLGKQRSRFSDDEFALDHLATRTVQHETRLDFETALHKLPAGAREVFVLHDIEGYKHEEIAELLGVTAGTSKSQLHRARMVLRDCLA
ncbi:MAG TPA: RNA polymerase sigma factor [Longimicrobiales bacterium]|nr:RNA polymerase sigma factor [Longimicrobiales bacterium]